MHKKILVGLVAGVLLLGAAGGTYGYVHTQNVQKAEKAASSSKIKSESISKKRSESKKKEQQKSSKNKSIKTQSTKSSDSTSTQQSNQSDNLDADAKSLDVSQFVGKYGMTYAQYLRENQGLSVPESLQAAQNIGAGMTSGEIQDLNGFNNGSLTESTNGQLTEATQDTSYEEKVRTPNADFTLADGTHVRNDSNGDSFDDKGQKIGKGGTGPINP